MTLPRLYGLNNYWRDHPPLHSLIGAFLGVKPADKPKQIELSKKEEEEQELNRLIADLGMAGLKMS
jgi:hypothetical protein